MCLLNNTVITVLMVLLIIQTIYDFYYCWEAFEKKYGREFKLFLHYETLRNTMIFFIGLLHQLLKMVALLVFHASLYLMHWRLVGHFRAIRALRRRL